MLELWPMMDPLGHPHVEGDMEHNSTHGLSILDHPDLPTTKPYKVKPFNTKNDTPNHHIQCVECGMLQINIIPKFKPSNLGSISTSTDGGIS